MPNLDIGGIITGQVIGITISIGQVIGSTIIVGTIIVVGRIISIGSTTIRRDIADTDKVRRVCISIYNLKLLIIKFVSICLISVVPLSNFS
jgi:hypothetical protein